MGQQQIALVPSDQQPEAAMQLRRRETPTAASSGPKTLRSFVRSFCSVAGLPIPKLFFFLSPAAQSAEPANSTHSRTHTHLTPYTSIKLITDTSGRRVNYLCLEWSQGATGQPLNYQHVGIRSSQQLNHCAKYKHNNWISWLLDGCVLKNNRHKASGPKNLKLEVWGLTSRIRRVFLSPAVDFQALLRAALWL